jgi:dTDP-glucose pyrophosphorylase
MRYIDIEKILLSPGHNMRAAIEVIDNSGMKIAIVVNEQRHLLGVVTDGDIRRALLGGHDLESRVEQFMQVRPRTAALGTERQVLFERLRHEQILHLPITDETGVVHDLAYLPHLERQPLMNNEVVIMAGGLGTRLRPLTEKVPKPLVSVGGRPLIDIIVDSLVEQGLTRITLCVNYLSHMLEEHLGDGHRYGAQIQFVQETKRMGTAGALSLLPHRPAEPFFVMNGDILTSIDFQAMSDFHKASKAMGTMAVNNFHYEVPYGVIEVGENYISALREKPRYSYMVNAGIYLLEPAALDHVPANEFFDMTSLFECFLEKKLPAAAFPLRERWMDIGRPEDLARAGSVYEDIQRET